MQFASSVSGSRSHPTFSLSPSHRPKKTNTIPVRVLNTAFANHTRNPRHPTHLSTRARSGLLGRSDTDRPAIDPTTLSTARWSVGHKWRGVSWGGRLGVVGVGSDVCKSDGWGGTNRLIPGEAQRRFIPAIGTNNARCTSNTHR